MVVVAVTVAVLSRMNFKIQIGHYSVRSFTITYFRVIMPVLYFVIYFVIDFSAYTLFRRTSTYGCTILTLEYFCTYVHDARLTCMTLDSCTLLTVG